MKSKYNIHFKIIIFCRSGWNTFRCISAFVLVSLSELVWTMHNICKVWSSNLDHKKKCISAFEDHTSLTKFTKLVATKWNGLLSLAFHFMYRHCQYPHVPSMPSQPLPANYSLHIWHISCQTCLAKHINAKQR